MGGGTTVHYREGGTNGTIQEYREFQPLVCATVTHKPRPFLTDVYRDK